MTGDATGARAELLALAADPAPTIETADTGTDLVRLLDTIDAVAVEHLPALLAHVAARLGGRLASAATQPEPTPEPDELLDATQAAAVIRRSVSWIRHNGAKLPGFSQPHGKGTAARWSRRQLAGWISAE